MTVSGQVPPTTYRPNVGFEPVGATLDSTLTERQQRYILQVFLRRAFRRAKTSEHLDRMIVAELEWARFRAYLPAFEAIREVHSLVISLALAGRRPEWGRVLDISTDLFCDAIARLEVVAE